MKHTATRKLVLTAMMACLAFVLNTFVYFPAMAPFQHFVDVVAAVFLGPWYACAAAFLCGVMRMMSGRTIQAIAGAVFGPILGGLLYRKTKSIWLTFVGEVIGTGIIGAVMSYPVMTFLWGREGLSWLFYVPSFICGTLIGGSIAYIFLRKLADNGLLEKLQTMLGENSYSDKSSVISNAATIAAFGGICFVMISILSDMFKLDSPIWSHLAYFSLFLFMAIAVVYYLMRKSKKD